MGGLVQSPPPVGANRSHSTGRGRSNLLSATHRVCPGGMTQTKGSPINPGRFSLVNFVPETTALMSKSGASYICEGGNFFKLGTDSLALTTQQQSNTLHFKEGIRMGNICVGGSSMAHQVNSPDRVSNNSGDDDHVTSSQLLSARHQLAESAGLPRDQHEFVSSQAPQSLRNRYNNLYSRTQRTLDMADMQHRYMTGASGINPGMLPRDNIDEMRSAVSEWSDMREALQHAMGVHADMPESPERFATTINPSGSIRMATLSPSPYRNW
ncbi:hypothetical protein ALP01_200117 [Pseudomonas caricapapayae]|nr:hypothetical protein ALP01_200117 [Pseudomonas caricapapayae]